MRTISVAKLKSSLSECLAKVKAGEELLVVSHGRPIGKIVPLPIVENLSDSYLLELERSGIVRIGTGKLPADFWDLVRPKDIHGEILSGLLEERRESK